MVDARTLRVALLAGGTSGEREISLSSGKGVFEALEAEGCHVTMLDPAKASDLRRLIDESFDVAFLCLHGKMGEDGTIQGFLELLGLPYTGSGVFSSALAMDKPRSKVFYEAAGLPTPPSRTLHTDEWHEASEASRDAVLEELDKAIGIPCVVKPATEGSALGVYIVECAADLPGAIDAAFGIDSDVMVERYVAGCEVTVAVLGNDDARALPVIEIIPQGEFYDFDSKYAPGGSTHVCPAPLSDDLTVLIQDIAVRAHHALACRGVSRSDLIVDAAGQPWLLETNTIPGMTATSLLPDAARAEGMSYGALCLRLIELALEG